MKRLRLFGVVIILLFLSSCGSSKDGNQQDVGDTTPPTVNSTNIADGAADMEVDTVITATFSEAMDASTITDTTFTLSTNPPVPGSVSYDPGTNTATFTPDADLDHVTNYTATITTGVKDLAGNNMASNYTWGFTTGSAVHLPETGQTTCYDELGAVRDCAGTGEDGDLLAGVAWPSPRFADNNDGTVTDELTGLMWLKDANCFGQRDWSTALSDANGLASGSCGLSDSSNAGDWRLPNINELESLYNNEVAIGSTWLNGQGFNNVQRLNYYMSSTNDGLVGDSVLILCMGDCPLSIGISPKSCILCTGSVWPVRAGQGGTVQLPQTGQTTCYDELGTVINCAGSGQDGDLLTGVA